MIKRLTPASKISLMLAMCFLIMLFHVWLRSLAVAEGYRVGQIRRDLKKAKADLLELHVSENQLMGPVRLERIVEKQKDLYGEETWVRASEANTLFVRESMAAK
ncbi:MAG TPA: hypothetical protein VM901_08340 [Bdellovibrionota bacterium]|jgi:hypothetical protein|nr:hypothetical protein [Bdellovibrionota bacterium]